VSVLGFWFYVIGFGFALFVSVCSFVGRSAVKNKLRTTNQNKLKTKTNQELQTRLKPITQN
jgi:hypothetical protein